MIDALKEYLQLVRYIADLIQVIERNKKMDIQSLKMDQKEAERTLKSLFKCAWYQLDEEDYDKHHRAGREIKEEK